MVGSGGADLVVLFLYLLATVPDSLDGDALLDRLRGQGLQVAIVVLAGRVFHLH